MIMENYCYLYAITTVQIKVLRSQNLHPFINYPIIRNAHNLTQLL